MKAVKTICKIIWFLAKLGIQAIVLLFAFIGLVTINACDNDADQKALIDFINNHYAGKKGRLEYKEDS